MACGYLSCLLSISQKAIQNMKIVNACIMSSQDKQGRYARQS